ncbi:MAG: efflux RND transporter periplasmic adaptor subunit [Rhodospirillales bacterium]
MKTTSQLAIIAVLAAVGAGAWLLKDQVLGKTAKAPAIAAPPILVQVKPVRVGTVTDRLEAVGTALANESVIITAKTTGIIEKITINEGERVKAGQLLVKFEDAEPLAELEAQKAITRAAYLAYERAIKLIENKNVAQARVDDLLSAWKSGEARAKVIEARLADLKLVAPFAGKVGLRRVSAGALVQPGATITTLDDDSVIRLKLSVPEGMLSNVKVGLDVEATTAAHPKRVFQGKVSSIDSRVDQISRAAEIRADIPNADGALKPGMFMSYKLVLARRESAMLVPEESLLAEGARQFVFVVAGDRAQKREVKIGDRSVGEVEILEGVKPNENVVVGGIQKIRNHCQVNVVGAPAG